MYVLCLNDEMPQIASSETKNTAEGTWIIKCICRFRLQVTWHTWYTHYTPGAIRGYTLDVHANKYLIDAKLVLTTNAVPLKYIISSAEFKR